MHDKIDGLDKSTHELFDTVPKITLISNTPDKSIVVGKQLLRTIFPYFDALFDSAFADSDRRVFWIEHLPGTSLDVELLLFEKYARNPIDFATTLRAFLRDKADLRSLVVLNRLAAYYGVDLQRTCEAELLFSWRTLRAQLTPRHLESLLKTCRALSQTTEDTDEAGYPTTQSRILSSFLGYHSPALRMAWSMSLPQQARFWNDLLSFTKSSTFGRDNYPGLVMPYFRIMQSLPPRPTEAEPLVLRTLVDALDETHFHGMKCHRESNGHQHGDHALHPPQITQRLSRPQLLWCWREWSDAEEAGRRDCGGGGGGGAGEYGFLLRRIKQVWDTMALNDELSSVLTKDQANNLFSELQGLSSTIPS